MEIKDEIDSVIRHRIIGGQCDIRQMELYPERFEQEPSPRQCQWVGPLAGGQCNLKEGHYPETIHRTSEGWATQCLK